MAVAQGRWWFRLLLVSGIGMSGLSANAQIIDRVDISPLVNGDAQILIRLVPNVLYMRHAPAKSGNALRIYFRVIGGDMSGVGQEQRESLRSPPSALVPKFRITYPENDGSLLVSFDKVTQFQVRQGNDGRSLSIVLPPAERSRAPSPNGAVVPAR
jgi:hypothetical protein